MRVLERALWHAELRGTLYGSKRIVIIARIAIIRIAIIVHIITFISLATFVRIAIIVHVVIQNSYTGCRDFSDSCSSLWLVRPFALRSFSPAPGHSREALLHPYRNLCGLVRASRRAFVRFDYLNSNNPLHCPHCTTSGRIVCRSYRDRFLFCDWRSLWGARGT